MLARDDIGKVLQNLSRIFAEYLNFLLAADVCKDRGLVAYPKGGRHVRTDIVRWTDRS